MVASRRDSWLLSGVSATQPFLSWVFGQSSCPPARPTTNELMGFRKCLRSRGLRRQPYQVGRGALKTITPHASQSSFRPESLEMLAAHDWPGNIRELANAIERASILAGNGSIHAEHLPTQFPARGRTQHSAAAHPPIASPHFTIPEGSPTLRDIEMSYIQAVLEKHNGNKPAASKELGISLKTLYNKINQLQQN